MLLYYVGGSMWLAARSSDRPFGLVALAMLPCCFLNSFGPISILIAKYLLNAVPKAQQQDMPGSAAP
jgi:hypothetical protein